MVQLKYPILLALSFLLGILSNAHSQVRMEVEGKIKISDDNSTPQNGDIRWNAQDDDFEGYINGQWFSLTLKIGLTCHPPDALSINGFVIDAALYEYPEEVQYISECDCTDGLDDDGDGDIDCADSDCVQNGCCNVECDCTNGIDDDGDGDTDCVDSDCASNFCCDGYFECNCNDGIDNDGNGLTDCADLNSCANNPCCNTSISECDCTDGIDNDDDGNTDCDDLDCCIFLMNQCPNCN